MPADVGGWLYGLGFLGATALLHAAGVAVAYLTSRTLVRAPRTTSTATEPLRMR
jgi:hydrogenase/urease accessory protein HupE